MGLMDQLSNILKNYTGGSSPVPGDVNEHFDQVTQTAPPGVVADGLSEAFRSDQTPAFGQMIGSLFNQSNGEQKAGFLNHLIASVGPAALAQIAGGGALSGLLNSGTRQLTPEQAQQIPPETVQQLAAHAEKTDPSIVDRASSFYAEHPGLVKTLGGAALSVALAKIAQRTSRAA